jgi:LmbE family N-acetylglucosaminyl deacetylase
MTILIIASHPDDEVLGAGATIAKLTKKGDDVYLLILGEGVTSREGWTQQELDSLHECIDKANSKIGISEDHIIVESFPDNRFDTVALLDIVKAVSKVKDVVKPDVMYTHSPYCLNIDHQRTYEAVVTATRPMTDETVKQIFSFEIPSSTEWRFHPSRFTPNVFVDVKETIRLKLDALNEYKSEMREYPHPRSLYGVYENAQQWGKKVGVPFAEVFECVRMVR